MRVEHHCGSIPIRKGNLFQTGKTCKVKAAKIAEAWAKKGGARKTQRRDSLKKTLARVGTGYAIPVPAPQNGVSAPSGWGDLKLKLECI